MFLIVFFMFCRHTSHDQMLQSFWALLNPEQFDTVTREQLADFLGLLQ